MLAALRFLIVAMVLIHGMLMPPRTLGQGPVVDQQAEKAAADDPPEEQPSIEFLKPLINVELAFVKRACELTDDQMNPIIAAAKKAHQAMADIVIKRDAGGEDFLDKHKVIFTGPGGELMAVNPYKRIRDDVAQFLKPLVTAEQYALFTVESRSRDSYERETATAFLLNLLDTKLVLSMQQREQMHKILMANWKEIDLHWLDSYVMPPSSFPPTPDHLIIPILSDSQRELFISQPRDRIHVDIDVEELLTFTEQWIDK